MKKIIELHIQKDIAEKNNLTDNLTDNLRYIFI